MRAVRGHASPRRLYAARMRLAIARGSRSHAARNRTPLAIARGSQSHAAPARKLSRPRAGCGRTRPRKPEYMMVMATSAEMLMRKRTRSASCSARPRAGWCKPAQQYMSSHTSAPRVKHAARALGIQRWQSQAGQARQGSSRRPAQTQTPARSGAGLLTHAASARSRGCRRGHAPRASKCVSLCSSGTTQGLSEPALVAEGKEAMQEEVACGTHRQAGWLRARLAACVRRTS